MNKMVDSMMNVDFSGLQIPMAVIYDSPRDFPGMYLCRIWEGAGCHPTDTCIGRANLGDIREDIKKAGFSVRFTRAEGDDPVIVETWMK